KITVSHKRDDCIGCGACTMAAPEQWSMSEEDGKAVLAGAEEKGEFMVAEIDEDALEANKEAADSCPVQIIKVSGHND
ncbi:MAG: ferredoxin, partial [Patescibacteria group bacterium]